MKENYIVPVNIAKELSEIDYDGKSLAQIDKYKAPIFDDAFDWFFIKHKIKINLSFTNTWKWEIVTDKKTYKQSKNVTLTQYEANKESLLKAIEIYKKNKE